MLRSKIELGWPAHAGAARGRQDTDAIPPQRPHGAMDSRANGDVKRISHDDSRLLIYALNAYC
jgi:hypothetical protein